MKKLLLLGVALLMTASVSRADHIGIFHDTLSASCNLGPAGFHTTAAVVHRFSLGMTGSRFKVVFPAGSNFFAFNTTFVPIGVLTSDLSLGYGQCYNGSLPLGTIVAVLSPGIAHVLPADGFPNIIFTACDFGEYSATGGEAYVGPYDDCYFAVESSTWGKVKSLYR